MSRGVIVGCDKEQEWMLSWWLKNFRAHNDLPVAFVDFGMTSHAQKWCKQQGALISLQASSFKLFYKPFALLQTPFKETIWLDLDCEILGSITHLFSKIHRHSRIALVRDNAGPNAGPCEEVEYNCGVIVYDVKSPLITSWASSCLKSRNPYISDKEVLMHLIQEQNVEVAELPSKYNWIVNSGINPDAVVLHWSGPWGKQVIRNRVA